MKKTFGNYLKTVILKNNLTQKEAANLLHVSPQALSNYILDKRMPDMKTMIHIFEVFHLDANQVFQLTGKTVLLNSQEYELIHQFRKLDPQHKEFIAHMLLEIPKNKEQ